MTEESSEVVVLKRLRKLFPQPGALDLGKPYYTLVAVLLSARTRDEQVLAVVPGFFGAFPDPRTLAEASVEEIEARINSIGMYRQKAKHLQKLGRKLVDTYHGRVPDTLEELVTLPGVGRKTASVVLSTVFDKPAIAVDTHVHRISNRLGWVRTKSPQQTERTLLPLVPEAWHSVVNRVMVRLGRTVCIPRQPRCWMCPVQDLCKFSQKNLVPPPNAAKIEQDAFAKEVALENLRQTIVKEHAS